MCLSDTAAAEPVHRADLLCPVNALDESECTQRRDLAFACGADKVWAKIMGAITAGLEYLVPCLSVGPVMLALIMFLYLSKRAASSS